MNTADPSTKPSKFFAPEVIQISEMDCGPASLKSILAAYQIHADYGRLREACQTSVDGTSIDDIEDIANQLGVNAEQIMVPIDHLLIKGHAPLPCMLVTVNPSGMTHFIVVYSIHLGYVQVMDPGVGRRWIKHQDLLDQTFIHSYPISPEIWEEWAKSDGFVGPLRSRLEKLGVDEGSRQALVNSVIDEPGWEVIAMLDAAVRFTQMFVDIKALETGNDSGEFISKLLHYSRAQNSGFRIPQAYWSVFPDEQNGSENLIMRGAVLIKIDGKNEAAAEEIDQEELEDEVRSNKAADIRAEVIERIKTSQPDDVEKQIFEEVKKDGWFVLFVVTSGFLLTSIGFSLQAVLLQSLFKLPIIFTTLEQKIGAVGMLLLFLFLFFILEIPLNFLSAGIGRKLEARMRVIFLKKIPLLGDRYFHSRLPSDMSARANGLKSIGELPSVAIRFVMSIFRMVLTMAGVIWLDPSLFWISLIATIVFTINGYISRPILEESDMRVRTHEGALSRYYLDALRGILPLRTHSAHRAFRREFESLLTEWVRASVSFDRIGISLQGISAVLYAFFSIWVGLHYSDTAGVTGGGLLLFYWTLSLPSLADEVLSFFQTYPHYRNNIRRVLEPLTAPEEANLNADEQVMDTKPATKKLKTAKGAHITIQDGRVEFSAKTVLSDVNLEIKPGEHIAIVGQSGAGKSSLLGLLLGWHQVVEGECVVDGKKLVGEHIAKVRSFTAWVDPDITLWNSTLFHNINYGSEDIENPDLAKLFEMSNLYPVIERLNSGAQTVIGESGGLVSGGEGQRVRLARAFQKPNARLAILDEPFRGMDRSQRTQLMKTAREHWKDATLLCVTHDLSETLNFPRVLVVSEGMIKEDGDPAALSLKPRSQFSKLLKLENKVKQAIWENPDWGRWNIDDGKINIVSETTTN